MPKKEQGKKKQIKPKKEKKSKKPVKSGSGEPLAKPKTLARAATPKTSLGVRKGAGPPTPHQPCCTDVLKTGQAYAIPFGFSDLKGTTRLPATVGTAPVPPAPVHAPPSPISSTAIVTTHASTMSSNTIVFLCDYYYYCC